MKTEKFDNKLNIEAMQEEILNFWDAEKTFEKSVAKQSDGETVFYDGPPFPTGKPHHGTVLVSFIKDMIARYWTMQGKSVPRVWGWDCHGLPIETQAEAKLGIKSKLEIESSVGVAEFNDACNRIVSENNENWRTYVRKMARWVDYDGAYKTMSIDFMESVLWTFKECYEKGLIYQDYRVTPYCCRCETSLSLSDTRESDSTRPKQDPWMLAKFRTNETVDGLPVYFLAWTTTPWTLPSNLALAVGENIDYAYAKVGGEVFVGCESLFSKYPKVFGKEPEILSRCKGNELVGRTYTPLFPYFTDKAEEGAFRIIAADFVDVSEGIGIVHIAPAFGEDDYWACKKNHIPLVNPVDEKGCFMPAVTDFEGRAVLECNQDIIRRLKADGLHVADGTLEHNYPHCWRCRQPLIYKAMKAWYFNIEKIKPRLLAVNEEVNWIPDTVKHGRFGKWLENARDWNISRNRYWSTPIPVWECPDCGERKILGSIDEIQEASGIRLDNLHKQYMDKVTFPCKCGATMSRIPEVFDCWFETSAVPYAQKHYPFENKDWFDSHCPADFVVEYTGQLRCWFYYLHVMSVALFDKPAFKNCVVHGTVLAKDGKKLSKSSKNYTDPMVLFDKYGSDAFRLYMYQSNAMLVGDLQFDEAGILEALQQIILPFWNSVGFFCSYASIDRFSPESLTEPETDNMLDRWILAKLYATEKYIASNMNEYRVDRYTANLVELIDGLTNWYIRRSRRRFWEVGLSADKKAGYETLYYVLVNICKLLAPVAPIIAEKVYRHLTDGESVHLSSWGVIPDRYSNSELLNETATVQDVIRLVRSIRNKSGIKNRIPLSKMSVVVSNPCNEAFIKEQTSTILEEVNVKELELVENVEAFAQVQCLPNFAVLRNKYGKDMPAIAAAVKKGDIQPNENGFTVTLTDGSDVTLEAEDVLVNYIAKKGLHVAHSPIAVVSLDLTLTDSLKAEGLARDIIRNIQESRKQMGCEIMDRITVNMTGGFPAEHLEMILGETLADWSDEISEPTLTVEVPTDDGDDVSIKIKK